MMATMLPVSSIIVTRRRRLANAEKVAALVESMQRVGLLNAITVRENHVLVAGLHRLEAAKALAWDTIPANVVSLNELDAELAEIDENLIRSDLTVLERSQYLKRRKEIYEARHPETRRGGAPGKAGGGKVAKNDNVSSFADNTAIATGESRRTIERQTRPAEDIVPEVQEQIAAHPVADNQAELTKLARQPDAVQREIAQRLVAGEAETTAQAVQQIRRQENRAELTATVEREAVMPTGVFDVVVIDPPWPMVKIERDVRPNQTGLAYPTMSIDKIAALDIPCAENAHVWLWTTHKFLPDAFQLLQQWGLKYVCAFVWHKPGGFQPTGLPQFNCEFALYARRGSPIFLDTKDLPLCFNAPRGAHSEKPECFYDMVRRTTAGRRLDMFNRRAIDGLLGYGKEAV